MQSCDSTCYWCAKNFWLWLKGRIKSQDRKLGRSGGGSFNDAASSSIKPEK